MLTFHRRTASLSRVLIAAACIAFPASRDPAPATAQPGGLAVVGQLGGPYQAVAVGGGHLLLGVGPRVIVQDACDPSVPVEVGRTEPLPGLVRDIVLRDHHAFVAASGGGLVVLDVWDPARPTVIGQVRLEGVAAKVRLQGDFAYVASGARGMRIVDIADPRAPREVGVFREIVTDLALAGDNAYVVARNLMQVNVTNPAAPTLTRKLEDWADAVAVQWPYVFAAISEARPGATRFGSLRVYDVSNPRRPAVLHTVAVGDQARALVLHGERVYYQGPARLTVVAQAVPNALGPVLGGVATPDSVQNLWPTGSRVLLAAGPAGLFTVNAGEPAAMRGAQAQDTLGSAESVAVHGTWAYVEDDGAGNRLLAVDIADPAAPRVRGGVAVGVDHGAIAAHGGYLYLGAPDRTLRVFDLRDPAHPLQVAAVPMPNDPVSGREQPVWRVAVDFDGHVYVAADEWLRVYDVTRPHSPRQVSQFRTSGGATDLAVHDRRAYILGPSTGTMTGRPSLQIVDVFKLEDPVELAAVPARVSQGGIQTDGAFVFADGLDVWDVRNPEHPAQVAQLQLPGRARDSARHLDRLYLVRSTAEATGSVHVVQVGSPAVPAEVARLELVEPALDVALSNGHVLVAAEGLGLMVLRDPALPIPTPQPTATATPGPSPTPTVALDVKLYLPVTSRGLVGGMCK